MTKLQKNYSGRTRALRFLDIVTLASSYLPYMAYAREWWIRNMVINLQENLPEEVCVNVEQTLGLRFNRTTASYGWGGKSAGFRTDQGTWLRVSYRRNGQLNERIWTGEECASVLCGVAKPRLLRSLRWLDKERGIVWRADELTLAGSPLVSVTPQIEASPELADEWWAQLTGSLSALHSHRTTRVGVRQDLVNRRIAEFAGERVDPTIDEWTTAHADLHWANVTAPDLQILDWEGWGVGPRGLDAATLWTYSLLVPPVAERIQGGLPHAYEAAGQAAAAICTDWRTGVTSPTDLLVSSNDALLRDFGVDLVGVTSALCVLQSTGVVGAWLGDVRIAAATKKDGCRELSRDHSRLAERVEIRNPTQADLLRWPDLADRVTRCLGEAPFTANSVPTTESPNTEHLLIYTDGLWNEAILERVQASNSSELHAWFTTELHDWRPADDASLVVLSGAGLTLSQHSPVAQELVCVDY